MVAVQLNGDSTHVSLPVQIEMKLRCMFGDLDAIGLDLLHSANHKLLLTLEPVLESDRSIEPIVRDITKAPFAQGYTTEFSLPRSEIPRPLGLFICKDSDEAGHCNGKEIADISAVISTYDVRNTPPRDYQPSDKAYFFQFLLVQGSTLYFYPGPIVERGYQELEGGLVETPETARDAAATVKRARSYLETVASEPLEAVNGSVVIALPRNDFRKCVAK